MTNNQGKPSFNPANSTNETGIFQEILKKFAKEFDVCLPAVVISYNRNTNIVTLQPAIDVVTTEGNKIQRAEVKVPVHTLAGGGFFFNFPLNEGDTGYILACDRDISIFKQNLEISNPNTNRYHCFEDSFFIPDKIRNFTIEEEDEGAVVLSSLNGTSKISLFSDKIVLKSSEIYLTTPRAIFSDVVEIPYPQFGNTPTAIGGARADVDYDTSGNVVSGTVDLATHIHSGVTSGGSNTGEPV